MACWVGGYSVGQARFLRCQPCLDCRSCCQRDKPSQSNKLVLKFLCSPCVLPHNRP